MSTYDLSKPVFVSTENDLDAKYRVQNNSARDLLITGQLIKKGHVIYNESDSTRYELKEYPTKGSLVGVVWEKVGVQLVTDLVTNDANRAASASTVYQLKGMVDNINTILASDEATLDSIQEIVDYIKQNKDDLQNLSIPNIAGLPAALDGKVDKVAGKGLSTNDLTNTLLANFTEAYNRGDHAQAGYALAANLATVSLSGSYNDLDDKPTNGTVGEVVFYAGATPVGVTKADGREVNRLGVYADLFVLFGTTFGDGDGATTFNLPSWDGKSLVPGVSANSDKDVYTGKYQHVALVATEELVLSGEQNINGVDYLEDQLVYARHQSTPSERKIYEIKLGAWVELAGIDYDNLFIVGSDTIYKTSGANYVAADFDVFNSTPNDAKSIVSYPDTDTIQIEITNHFGAFHAGIRFSVVGQSNQGLLSANEVLGTDANGDVAVINLDSTLEFVNSTLKVKDGVFLPASAMNDLSAKYDKAGGDITGDIRVKKSDGSIGITDHFGGGLFLKRGGSNNNPYLDFISNGDWNGGTYMRIGDNDDSIKIYRTLKFDDYTKTVWGTDGDLEIYHSGNYSNIDSQNHSLRIRSMAVDEGVFIGATVSVEDVDTYYHAVRVTAGFGNVGAGLYYNGAPKLSTLDGGVGVYGNLLLDGQQILTSRQPAISDLSGSATLTDVINKVNEALAMLRTHGLIAT